MASLLGLAAPFNDVNIYPAINDYMPVPVHGEVASVNELAEQQGVDASLIGRTLRLATLAPDITQAILAGQEPYGLSIRRLTKGLPTWWGEQRENYGFMAFQEKVA